MILLSILIYILIAFVSTVVCTLVVEHKLEDRNDDIKFLCALLCMVWPIGLPILGLFVVGNLGLKVAFWITNKLNLGKK